MLKRLLKKSQQEGTSFLNECLDNWYLLSYTEQKALFQEVWYTLGEGKEEDVIDNLYGYQTDLMRSIVEADFIYYLEEYGWDKAIEFIQEALENKEIEDKEIEKELNQEVNNYYEAYNYAIDGDIDGGKCYQMREKAIQNIIAILERTL